MADVVYYTHINRQIIDRNRKHGLNEPPVSIRRGKRGKSTYCFEAELPEGSVISYSPHELLLPCGARLVIKSTTHPRIIR